MTDDEEKLLRQDIMTVDLKLKRKQVVWETPRNIAIFAGVVATIAATIGGFAGYKIGQTPPAPIVIQLQQPGHQ